MKTQFNFEKICFNLYCKTKKNDERSREENNPKASFVLTGSGLQRNQRIKPKKLLFSCQG